MIKSSRAEYAKQASDLAIIYNLVSTGSDLIPNQCYAGAGLPTVMAPGLLGRSTKLYLRYAIKALLRCKYHFGQV
jgi:hypothetical protein